MFRRDQEPDRHARREPAAPGRAVETWAKDLATARGAVARDPEALDRFIERMRCVPRIVTHLNRHGGPILTREALEDLVQDILAFVWDRLPQYRGEATLETWVFRICSLRLRNARRREIPRQAQALEAVEEPTAAPQEPRHDSERLQLCLDSLPEAEAVVVRLKHYEEMTFEQIATQLRQSPNTVKTRYYRGLTVLRRKLHEPEAEQ